MAKPKNNYYAVRKGLKPGIYKTWKECEAQVKGVKGAEFKGFVKEEDAIAYLNGDSATPDSSNKKVDREDSLKLELEKTKELSSKENALVVYVDGSYSMKIPNCPYTYGFALIKNNEVIHKGNGYGQHEEAKKMNNVAGELAGTMKASLYIANNYKDIKNIYVFHDYQGIGDWFYGKWKTKNSLTKQYVEFMKKLEVNYGIKIDFVKVAGHAGNPFNELVDKLAKEALEPFKQ